MVPGRKAFGIIDYLTGNRSIQKAYDVPLVGEVDQSIEHVVVDVLTRQVDPEVPCLYGSSDCPVGVRGEQFLEPDEPGLPELD